MHTRSNGEPGPSRKVRRVRTLIVLAAAAVALIVAWKYFHLKDHVLSAFVWILEWMDEPGRRLYAPLMVVVIYVAACVLMLPGSVLTLGAGFLFGVLVGTVTVSIGSTLGACAAFLVGRTLARNWVYSKVAGNARFAAIDEAVGEESFRIILLTRLSPVFPFNLLNYAYGLTRAPFWKYALASWIGMLPGTLMYVYIGSSLRETLESVAQIAGEREKTLGERIFFWVGLAVTLAVVVYVTRVARRVLSQKSRIEAAGRDVQQPSPESEGANDERDTGDASA